jgi:hypothetical protein
MHMIATRATKPKKVLTAASLAPKTDEDWHTPHEVNTLSFLFFVRSPPASYLEGMYMEDIPRHKDFTRSKLGDVSAFLCHFLEGQSIKPKKVLKAKGLPTTDLHDTFDLQALYEAASPYMQLLMPATVVSDTDSDTQSEDYD